MNAKVRWGIVGLISGMRLHKDIGARTAGTYTLTDEDRKSRYNERKDYGDRMTEFFFLAGIVTGVIVIGAGLLASLKEW